jgi:polyisoprenoid-binding protein YceI
MKFSSILSAGLLVISLAAATACTSEIDNKPAAQVSDVSASDTATATETASKGGPVVTVPVIKEASSIGFIGAKVTRDHVGTFKTFDGSIEYAGQQPNRISFEIDPGSAVTDTEKLDAHLRSADFFDVANHPKATFTSQNIREEIGADGSTHRIDGILNLRGVDKAISFPVKVEKLPDGVRATSEFTINRKDWNVSYTGAADDLIKDDVLIRLDLRFPPPPAA